LLVIAFTAAGAFLVYKFPQNFNRLVAENIVLDIAAMVIWLFPETHWSVYQLGYLAAIVEAEVTAAVFAIALYGFRKRKTWAPMLALAMTVIQRLFATYIFFPNPALALTLIWSL
jgi:hypothetical protein